ncbi:MAG: signal peptidase II [Flavobacteriales bacterium]|nr:signal peptidase II [Flavobacteriia bacterium]NCP51479.1 signal peptidase II [Flavobacteriales bacterium]NCQ15714.1 signal peptidase II [Flavobacteriales bacterium]NCQ56546.1 signal peptidase II [Flavobacteriales bacterium]NCT15946.1 signal peptidase II [Flavobacteriales bacterium]
MKLSRRSLFIILTIILTIAIDQISKILVRTYVIPSEKTTIIGTYFTLHNVENTGAFLGMGSDLSPVLKLILLLILPIAVLGFVTVHIFKDKSLDNLSIFAFASIIGGGIANVFDRIVYGSVTDFFHIDLGGVFRTGIFNMADLSVTTGMIILLLVSFRKKKTL